jgi:hypothetical protein
MDSKAKIETVSAVAVFLGLVFVGLELKQNTEAVESQTSQGLLEMANQANDQIASNQQLAELVLRVSKGVEELDELEALQYGRFVHSEMNIWEHAFFSHENGTMHSDLWSGYDGAYRGFFCDAWSKEVWETIKHGFSEQFKAHVDKITPEVCLSITEASN